MNKDTEKLVYTYTYAKDSFGYTVKYYYDENQGDAPADAPTGGSAEFETKVTLSDIPATTTVDGSNYVLVSENHSVTIEADSEKNVIKVYYEKDVIGEETPGEPDGIPDKYQKTVTYKVVNGRWNDGKKTAVTEVVTLRDSEGNPSTDGIVLASG